MPERCHFFICENSVFQTVSEKIPVKLLKFLAKLAMQISAMLLIQFVNKVEGYLLRIRRCCQCVIQFNKCIYLWIGVENFMKQAAVLIGPLYKWSGIHLPPPQMSASASTTSATPMMRR